MSTRNDGHGGHERDEGPADGERAAIRAAARGGWCASCRHARGIVSARGSAFLRCLHPRLPKYPRQPVMRCDGFEASEP